MFIEGFSQLLGYTSIGCWLGAQFPQVLENIRRQSCEGLSLPFLFNWMMGDMCNLIGCLLTHQLPFQTYLATYFCLVDCALLGQYVYYGGGKISSQSIKHGRTRTVSAAGRTSTERGALHYRTLSTVAANVAAAAARAVHDMPVDEDLPYRTHSQAPTEDGLDYHPSTLTSSTHSELCRTGRLKRVSWSQERQCGNSAGHVQAPVIHASHQLPTSQHDTVVLARGRSLQREVESDVEEEVVEEERAERRLSTPRANSRASRRGAGIVFLGVWSMFSIGTLAGRKYTSRSTKVNEVGKVFSVDSDVSPLIPSQVAYDRTFVGMTAIPSNHVHVVLPSIPSPTQTLSEVAVKEQPGTERIIGRIFAWVCTVLYLTSRLPQIWKNYSRKSVEGLSMLLFVCAFLGNFFYVSSILSSPKMFGPVPESTDFIKESIPYLLGSGGTFMFDITIVSQFYMYRYQPYQSRFRGRSSSVRRDEETAALLGGSNTLGDSHTHHNQARAFQSRSRTSSSLSDR